MKNNVLLVCLLLLGFGCSPESSSPPAVVRKQRKAETFVINKRLSCENSLYNSAIMGYNYHRAGQRINAIPTNSIIKKVSIYMDKVGKPKGIGSCVVRKVSDNSIVGTLGTVDVSTLPDKTASHPKWVVFDKSVKISKIEDYRIVFEWDTAGGDKSNYPRVRYNNTDTVEGELTYCNAKGAWADAPDWDTSIKVLIGK